jgi:RNA polymerase-interacting CarD/CdnL/TRCF family regulator
MNDIQHFKVGDKIVDYGQVFRIFKIRIRKVFGGKKVECIFYKQHFRRDKNQPLVCSIPKSNVKEANLRKPVSEEKIEKTLKLLGEKPNHETIINATKAATYFKENNPLETARLLRLLWLEKQDEEKKLSNRKKNIYQKALRNLVEEMAVVQNIGLKEARNKIRRRLKKICLEKKEEKYNK